jgi:hypothetical protein
MGSAARLPTSISTITATDEVKHVDDQAQAGDGR